MVRLEELKTIVETCGTTGHALSPTIPDNMIRHVYRLRLHQKGATLGNVFLYGNLGATLGATLDMCGFEEKGEMITFPPGALPLDAAPIWKLNRATYDSIFVSVEVASVDLYLQYADKH